MTSSAPAALRSATSTKTAGSFAADVVTGLSATPKQLPPKYFYDAIGSALFEQITHSPEYYPTRCELAILRNNAPAMASLFPPACALVEFGSGSSRKARILIGAAATVEAYVPIDLSGDFVQQDAAQLSRDFPRLVVHPLVADFAEAPALPNAIAAMPRVGFFPGSTIGNFEPHQAARFLRRTERMLGSGGLFLVGVDLVKAPEILHRAYNDAAGVTAKFNVNLLARINRELGARFDLAAFEHRAFYNSGRRRVEMHLASLKTQKIEVAGREIDFRAGETIHTENSYKYSIDAFKAMARHSGWSPFAVWTDGMFSVHALRIPDNR